MVTPEIQQVKLRFGIIGNADGLNRAIDIAMQVAPTDLSVLITGESGVGKEAFPKIIHEFSRRKHSRKYIAVNCGAIPEGTIDSELFGHEKGAFTGAIGERQGYFGEANGGTIFLDEVGELPLATQARLLRVLESGEYIRVGSSKVEKTDVRIVAATNVNLLEAISDGRFREDLFYRLNTVPITIPPLRERGNDIGLLFRKFANDFAENYRMPPIQLTGEALQLLQEYPWPGNVRQLKNITEQISIIERTREITPNILRMYVPDYVAASRMPALVKGHSASSGKTFESEREILYQILFDLRRDMTELKRLVHSNLGQMQSPPASTENSSSVPYYPAEEIPYPSDGNMPIARPVAKVGQHGNVGAGTLPHMVDDEDIQDTDEYIEESLSFIDLEREAIRKALEKHNGRRNRAAKELKISERTLYRKIKEYGLE